MGCLSTTFADRWCRRERTCSVWSGMSQAARPATSDQCSAGRFPEPLPWMEDGEPNGDMWVRPSETKDSVVEFCRRVWAHSDATIDALPLEAVGEVPWWPEGERELYASSGAGPRDRRHLSPRRPRRRPSRADRRRPSELIAAGPTSHRVTRLGGRTIGARSRPPPSRQAKSRNAGSPRQPTQARRRQSRFSHNSVHRTLRPLCRLRRADCAASGHGEPQRLADRRPAISRPRLRGFEAVSRTL